MKVVLPLPAMPTHTIATGGLEVLALGTEPSVDVEVDMITAVYITVDFIVFDTGPRNGRVEDCQRSKRVVWSVE
jgi:hypothetical protein